MFLLIKTMSYSRGYVALLSVLLVSAFLLALIADRSIEVFIAQDSVAHEISYRASLNNAWSCVNLALNRLSVDSTRFDGTGKVSIVLSTENSCDIISASTTAMRAEISTNGHSGESFTPLYVVATRASSTAEYLLHSWEER
jgi:hypothetical protein